MTADQAGDAIAWLIGIYGSVTLILVVAVIHVIRHWSDGRHHG